MWINDILRALNILKETYGSFLLIHDIKQAYDGIVFHCTDNYTYKYYNMTDTVERLKSWRTE